ncbi:hypothetical protein QYE76_035543 [Lolium multiflorum]|uniref:DUF4218 domain-containing protein n=1 Tax=Lolium multiflorum TaxID=4521 RepID=A0AAD8VP36_LOLMU|nr:hypothetical protein QYE76_035543 [Lolium multiflorum]
MMEDGDEEEDNDDQYRSMFSECDDTAMDDNEEEGGEERASDDPVDDDLRRAISDARRDCATDKERLQFDKRTTTNCCTQVVKMDIESWVFGVYGKTKDTPKAREDQERHKGRNGNHPGQFVGPASYALTKQEKEIFFEALFSIKVPSGFSSNIKGIVNMKEKKFQNLKSHDCDVLMTQLLPVALRGLLPENVRLAIVKICAFLNAISQKVMDPETLSGLQEDVVECLISFELLFPPSFFNIMTHLLVHLVEEIRILGPVFLHNMFPFERFMGVLKKYVHNLARPEGSISKGYGTEEVIEFCVDFLPDLKPIGVPESRYEEDGPPPSNFNEAGHRMWWRGRTLQSVMAYRGPAALPSIPPTRGHPPRFDNRDPDASDDDVGDYDDYSGDYYRARHDYD